MIPQSNPQANYLAHRHEIDAAIARVLESGWYILGSEVSEFENEFAIAMNSRWSTGLANGTDAVEISLRALGIGPGDHVITVSHTAVATVAAIARIGASPLFVDIDPSRYTMCPESLAEILRTRQGQKAKALVVVHLYGGIADMPAIMALADASGLPVVEDCAQSHGARLSGKPGGSWGRFATYSFYPTKNLGALGDGGAICGNDDISREAVRLLREYGWKNRYISQSFGFNSRLDALQAAILRAKLPYLEAANNRRRAIARRYDLALSGTLLQLPKKVEGGEPVFHQYVIQVDDRASLQETMRQSGIGTLVHYPAAVHQQPAYSSQALRPVGLSQTELAIPRILSLPIFPELTDQQVDSTSDTIRLWAKAR